MIYREICSLALLTALGVAVAGVANAQDNNEYEAKVERFKVSVSRALPEALENPSAVVDNLHGAKLGPQLSQSFNYARVWSSLVGRQQPSLDPACKRTGTPSGDADQGECTASLGSEGGSGEYKQLSFSKNIGLGNIKFLSRPKSKSEQEETQLEELAIKLTDQQAYDKALAIAKLLGLASEELALPPEGVALPVRSLQIGGAEGDAKLGGAVIEPVTIQKVVMLPRGLDLPEPIQLGNFEIQKVRAPGEAWIALGDPLPTNPSGIQGIGVSNWMDLRRNEKPGPAKTRDELVDEIARTLVSLNEGAENVPEIKILIGLSAESKGTYGLLLPAVQVYSSPLTRDPDEATQTRSRLQTNTAGTLFEVALTKSEGVSER